MTRIRFNHIVADEIVESDLIEATPEEWEESPESKTGAWSAWKEPGRVIANRLVGVPVFVNQEAD
jgi:hypothetical protein